MSSILPFVPSRFAAANRVQERPSVALSLLGTGQVGGALLRQLAERGSGAPRLVGVANSRRALSDGSGIDPGDAINRLWAEGERPGLEAEGPRLSREMSGQVRRLVGLARRHG